MTLAINSAIVFLPRHGLVIRHLSPDLYENLQLTEGCDLVVQPFKLHPLEKGALAIVPAVRMTKCKGFETIRRDQPYKTFIEQQSKGAPYKVSDLDYNNIGLLPAQWEFAGRPRAFPSILDYGSWCPHPMIDRIQEFMSLSQKFEEAAWRGIQARTFAPMQSRLLDAWPDNSLPKAGALRSFFRYCAENVALADDDAGKLLFPGWLETKGAVPKTLDAAQASQKYDRAITQAAIHCNL